MGEVIKHKEERCPEHAMFLDNIGTLKHDFSRLVDGQEVIKEAIAKMSQNMAFLSRLEKRVSKVESRMDKVIGGLILSSVLTPIIMSMIFTLAWYFMGEK